MLTLSQAVTTLQLGLRNFSHLNDIAPQLAQTVRSAGDLVDWNLPEQTVGTLTRIRDGGFLNSREAMRSLALLTARVGAEESGRVGRNADSERSPAAGSMPAIRELFSTLPFSSHAPSPGFWARMADPSDGFSPFMTERGTKVAFFPKPPGLGLVVFLNEKANCGGLIFVHGVGRAPWSRPTKNLWLSSGGTMAFPRDRLTFDEALARVLCKGAAMTLQWRSVDEALQGLGHKTPTGLGGSQGILLHGTNGLGFAMTLKAYAEVLTVLGITLTGSDEGVGPEAADALARMAPENVVGSKYALYRGHPPVAHTADGVFRALGVVHEEFLGGAEAPVLLAGHGGIGSLLFRHLEHVRKMPITGVVDADPENLCDLRKSGASAPLFQDRSAREPSAWESLKMMWNGVGSERGLVRAVEKLSETRILSPNAGQHPITFDVAAAMIAGGVRAAVGAAYNQNVFDPDGSPDSIAWILQAGGVFHAADFAVSRTGAAAVISNAIVLGFDQLRRMVRTVGESVQRQIEDAFRRGVPPFLFERDRAARAWNERLTRGEARGGRF
jgi:hypothetical protein